MLWVRTGWLPADGWNLPDELQHPNKFAFTSDQAQFIIDAGYAGYGQARPVGWDRYRVAQGRSLKAGGYRGYGMSWDRLANRLVVPQ